MTKTIRTLEAAIGKEDLCCADVLCCMMGLSSTDALVFSKVGSEKTVSDLVKETKKSQTRVQVSLNRLVMLGLIGKASTKSRRGAKYIYAPIPKEALKKRLIGRLDRATKKLRKEIEEL